MATIAVKDATGATQNLEVPLTTGQKTSALSRPIVIASDQSAVPVSGTVAVGTPAVTQSGTWTVQPGNTANTTAWKVDGSAAIQLGAGAATGTTQRVTMDTGQLGALVKGAVPTVSGGTDFQFVNFSSTSTLQNTTGTTGDYLESVLCVVATAATAQVQIKDGSGTAITVLPNNPGAGVGSYPIPIGATSKLGAWQVITLAGVTVIATGKFT